MDEITGQYYILLNYIRVNEDKGPEDFIALEVFDDLGEANYALQRMRANHLEPENFRQDKIEFEGELAEAVAMAPVRTFVVRWDQTKDGVTPGVAEVSDHVDHIEAAGENPGWAYV